MKTTLNKIRSHSPCVSGWTKLLKNLGKTCADDEPLAITTILDSNGVDDALWCLRAVDGHQKEMRLYAVDCARSVQHLIADPRSVAAIDVAQRHAYGLATDSELAAARAAAGAAARAAAWAAAGDAAQAAEWAAAGAAAQAAEWAAAGAAAGATAWAAAREVQADLLRIVCAEIEQGEKK
jgi:hypothetical protein